MYECDYNEIELKLSFDYDQDYFTQILIALEPYWGIRRQKTKAFKDHYYDTSDYKLLQNNYSYRIRINENNKKYHVNFKYPFIYNQKGIVTRREIKSEIIDKALYPNFDLLVMCDCLANSHLKAFLKQSCEFKRLFCFNTIREVFVLSRLDGDFGVMCIDHSELLLNSTRVSFTPQLEIELWNDSINPALFEDVENVTNLLMKDGFKIQTTSRYRQAFDLMNNLGEQYE